MQCRNSAENCMLHKPSKLLHISWPHSSTTSSGKHLEQARRTWEIYLNSYTLLGTSADSRNWKHLSIGEKWRWVSRAGGLEFSGCREESKKRRTQWLEMQFMQTCIGEYLLLGYLQKPSLDIVSCIRISGNSTMTFKTKL
jgi:hypothetical protein